MWHDLMVALALLLVLEGILPFLNPAGMRKTLKMMSEMGEQRLRVAGLSSMVIGLVLLYLVN